MVKHITLHIQIGIQNIHSGNNRDITNVDGGPPRRKNRRIEKERGIRNDLSQIPHFHGLESIHGIGIGLGNIVRRHDAIIEDNESPSIAGLGIGSNSHGLEEIIGPVGRDGGGRSHGTDNNNGLGAVDSGIHEEGGFLHRIGAMCDDSTSHGRIIADDLVDEFRELQVDGRGHVLAIEVCDLDACNVCLGCDLGHGVDQGLDSDGTGFVACCC